MAATKIDLSRLTEIYGYKRKHKAEGIIHRKGKGLHRRYRIGLNLTSTDEDVLHAWSHEAAHVQHWKHTDEHLALTGELFALCCSLGYPKSASKSAK